MFKPTARRPNALKVKKIMPREDRIPMAKSATLCLDGASLVIPCTVRDLSSRGARISVANVSEIPDEFLLIVRSEDLVARAKAEWRDHAELGMVFLRKGELYEEDKFRQMQSTVFKQQQEKLRQIALEKKRIEDEKLAIVEQRNQKTVAERNRIIKILGLDPNRPFTESDLKRAYRQQAMTKHPDHGGSMEEFMELNNAYRMLITSLNTREAAPTIISL